MITDSSGVQPINEGGQSPGASKSKGPPSATCKNLCHEIITDALLTSDTLTISGECYDISNSNVQPKSKIMLVLYQFKCQNSMYR